ncbi:GlxA family transcriptional regulator [Roseibium sp. M-1]
MRTVGFVTEDGFQVMGLAALSAFDFANMLVGREFYRVTVMSEAGSQVRSSLGLCIQTEPLDAMPDTLMVLGKMKPKPITETLKAYLARAGKEARRVAGVCTGAFVLAEAGLLDGRTATTHWVYARNLQQDYPDVRVEEDRIFVNDGNVWTSAGMSAAIDLTLALIEDDLGAEIARGVAQRLVVYYRRTGGQSQFSVLLDVKPRSDRVRRALTYARENLQSTLSVEELADVAGLSPRQFSRVFHDETGMPPAKMVEQLRLEFARTMLEEGRHSFDEVARDAGFGDRERMRRAFLRVYGQPPQAMRRSLRRVYGSDTQIAEATI